MEKWIQYVLTYYLASILEKWCHHVNKVLLKKEFHIKALYLLKIVYNCSMAADWRVSSWHKKEENGKMLSPCASIIISINFGKWYHHVNKELLKKEFHMKAHYLLKIVHYCFMADWCASIWLKKEENGEMVSPRIGIIISINFGKMISPHE